MTSSCGLSSDFPDKVVSLVLNASLDSLFIADMQLYTKLAEECDHLQSTAKVRTEAKLNAAHFMIKIIWHIYE